MEIKLCETQAQREELAQCAKRIWNEYFTDLLSQEQIDYMVERFQSYPALTKTMEQEHYTYFLAYEESELIGYCGVQPREKELFLSKLYLQKSHRGHGIASILLAQAITFAHEKGCESITLTCNKYNTNSLAVYHHKGFVICDEAVTDIGHGFVMDDYILKLTLS